jgi:hypothetical protein
MVVGAGCGGSEPTAVITPPAPFAAIAGRYVAFSMIGGASLPYEIKLTAPIIPGPVGRQWITDYELVMNGDGTWSDVGHLASTTDGKQNPAQTFSYHGTFGPSRTGLPQDFLGITTDGREYYMTTIGSGRMNVSAMLGNFVTARQ